MPPENPDDDTRPEDASRKIEAPGLIDRLRRYIMGNETTERGPDGAVGNESPETARLREERDDLQNRLLRLAADLDNIRRRQAREIDSARQRERENILRGVVEAIDNFDRALAACGAEQSEWLEGLEGIRQQLLEVLRRSGARPFDATGAKFDPQRHEAVAAVAAPGREEGTILEVIQTGYEFEEGAVVLRPARVVVVRQPAG